MPLSTDTEGAPSSLRQKTKTTQNKNKHMGKNDIAEI